MYLVLLLLNIYLYCSCNKYIKNLKALSKKAEKDNIYYAELNITVDNTEKLIERILFKYVAGFGIVVGVCGLLAEYI